MAKTQTEKKYDPRKHQAIRIKVTLEGTAPMLLDPMSEETLIGLHARKSAAVDTRDMTLQQVAEMKAKCYQDEEGRLGIPVANIFAVLRGAGVHVQYKAKAMVSKADRSTKLTAFLNFEGQEFFPFDPEGTPAWVPDARRGQNRNAGNVATCIIRPKLKKWRLSLVVRFELDTPVTEDRFKDLFNKAGRLIGLCAFRPSCGGPFGVFRVAGWDVIEAIPKEENGTTAEEPSEVADAGEDNGAAEGEETDTGEE